MGVRSWGNACIVATGLLLLCTVPSLPNPRPRHPEPVEGPNPKLILVVANRLTLDDIDSPSLPNIQRLFREGSIGLISPNCPRPHTENSVLLTAATGTPCTGGSFLQEFYDRLDPIEGPSFSAGDEYATRTGFKAPELSAVFLGLGPAEKVTGPSGRPICFGLIGDSLHRVRKLTAAVGDADSDARPNRAVSVLACDSRGIIDRGLVGWAVPYHDLRTDGDVSHLLEGIRFVSADAALTVVNYGLSTQLDEQRDRMSDEALAGYWAKMLRGLDTLVGELMDDESLESVALVSFSPSMSGTWNRLTPIAIHIRGKQAGLLTSATTRTPGLISATDIAPTLLTVLDVHPVHRTVGLPARTISSDADRLAVVHSMDKRVTANHVLLIPLLASFAAVGGLALTVAAVLFALRKPISRRVSIALRFGMVYASCSGLATMLAVLAPSGVVSYAVASVAIAIAISTVALLLACFSRLRAPLLLTFGATAFVLVLDALTGGHLIRFSVTSSDQLDGFRYYGIGNEYGSALICMTALVALFSAPRYRMALAAVLGAAVVTVLGTGSLGANYGATAAAVVTFALILVALRRGGYRAMHVIGSLIAGVLIAGGFAYLDWLLTGSASTHGARLIGGFGLGSVAEVAWRKLSMNLRIAGQDSSARIFLAFVPFMALWFYVVQPRVKQMIEDDRCLVACLKAVVVGAVAALLLNDSGVLMAVFMVAMTVLVLVYSLVESPDRQLHSHSSMSAGGNAGGCEGGAEPCQG